MRLLEGKNAVITGCLKGIGRATMDLFASEGANVWACCESSNEEFEQHVQDLSEKENVSITPFYFDLSNTEQIKKAMKDIISFKLPIDALINVAGVTQNSLFHMTSLDSMRSLFEIDFFSQMLITQMLTKVMVRQKSGSVINISSITATDGNSGQVSYAAAKAALIGASKTLAIELGTSGIRVNVVSPGVIKTSMTESLSQDKLDGILKDCKLHRCGLPEEVASTLVFLASDQSSYITGQNIRIDGGIGG